MARRFRCPCQTQSRSSWPLAIVSTTAGAHRQLLLTYSVCLTTSRSLHAAPNDLLPLPLAAVVPVHAKPPQCTFGSTCTCDPGPSCPVHHLRQRKQESFFATLISRQSLSGPSIASRGLSILALTERGSGAVQWRQGPWLSHPCRPPSWASSPSHLSTAGPRSNTDPTATNCEWRELNAVKNSTCIPQSRAICLLRASLALRSTASLQ